MDCLCPFSRWPPQEISLLRRLDQLIRACSMPLVGFSWLSAFATPLIYYLSLAWKSTPGGTFFPFQAQLALYHYPILFSHFFAEPPVEPQWFPASLSLISQNRGCAKRTIPLLFLDGPGSRAPFRSFQPLQLTLLKRPTYLRSLTPLQSLHSSLLQVFWPFPG